MKKKLSLKELKVTSFLTKLEAIKGGNLNLQKLRASSETFVDTCQSVDETRCILQTMGDCVEV